MAKIKKKKTVFVGLSGGVDSAVSAALLKIKGYEVVGVFIKTWHPDFLSCNEEEEQRDAMRVAAFLDIPFLTFDFEDVYKKEVGDYIISEYKKGNTPNPDVMCNKEVKFGAFLNKALVMGADYVATGHYAQNYQDLFSVKKNFLLKKSCDPSKDQSYFLWTLKQDQLSKILFPIGHLKKTEVRKLAEKFNLPVAQKKDSQGICFLGSVDIKDFLKHYIKEKKGKVLNEDGEEIGFHNGAIFCTLGERHGFTITKKSSNDGASYVFAKDIKKNILYVRQNPLRHSDTSPLIRGRMGGGLLLKNINWISEIPDFSKKYTAQVRYHGEFLDCKIENEKSKNVGIIKIIFNKNVLVASGQSVVVYDGDICLGGGVVI